VSRNIAKIDYLIRLGLGKSEDKLTYYRQAVTDPVKSVTNPQLRGYVAELLDDLLDFVFDDQTTWNRIQTLLQKNKKKNEEEDTAMTDEVEIVEDIDTETNPLQQKLAAQRQQLQKQKAQIRLQLQQKRAQKQIQTMKQKGQQELAKEDEDLEENSMGYVYDPITKKNVPRKGPKVKVGGGATNNGKDVETGPSKKWSKTDEELTEAKMFPSLDDSADSHHHRMIHSVTQYDRTQEKKSYYNPYALPQYLGAVQRTTEHIKNGMDPSEAINRNFNGSLAARLHKHLGLSNKKDVKESLDETAIAQEKSGRANYWYRQHTNRYQMYLRNGDMAKAEAHRKKAIEFKRRSYDALDNPEKLMKF